MANEFEWTIDSKSSRDAIQIDLWWIDLDAPFAAGIPEWLPSEDRDRVARMGTERLRHRMANTRVALRNVLAGYLAQSPGQIKICTGAHGWPHLDPSDGSNHVWFNLTHAQDQMLIAVSRDVRLGVDLERVDRRVEPDKLANAVFNQRDIDWMNAQADRHRAFMKLWTAKEAVLKLCGTGFQIPAPLVIVDWETCSGSIAAESKYLPNLVSQLHTIRHDEHWSAHIAVAKHPPAPLEFREYGSILTRS